eukprot:TRINITY_DN105028_c0_g1_i1.p1 TRINITY_DN105028_c0_g1~~TRINITY_DN105028_c0_g1_i1.p1  ORF type:complete len:460 (+),score=25.21 TRINITY_DN105028_c0_g1_i1:228-1607(+)
MCFRSTPVFLIFLVLLACISAKPIMRQKVADKLKAEAVGWKVADPNKSVFRDVSVEDFKARLKSQVREPIPPKNNKPRRLQGYDSIGDFFGEYDPWWSTPSEPNKNTSSNPSSGSSDDFWWEYPTNPSGGYFDEDSWWKTPSNPVQEPIDKNTSSNTSDNTSSPTSGDNNSSSTPTETPKDDNNSTSNSSETNNTSSNSTNPSTPEQPSWKPPSNPKDIFYDGDFFWDGFWEEPPAPKPIVLPESFDAREKWPNCSHPILDQGDCSGCWALGIANLLSDRFCVNGLDVILSQQDILECTFNNSCCTGGVASKGYKYLMENGTVDSLCKPYDIQCGACRNTTGCTRYKCKPNSDWYSNDVNETKKEIFLRGPVQGVFDVYEDFVYYESGVYSNTTNKYLGVHSIEVLGWGKVDNTTEYWLCKNSWGKDWGMNGYFKIKMGNCGINDFMSACDPLIPATQQ